MGVSLRTIECRMDYMGSSVLMARLNDFKIGMKDEWLVQDKPSSDTPLATSRYCIQRGGSRLSYHGRGIKYINSDTPLATSRYCIQGGGSKLSYHGRGIKYINRDTPLATSRYCIQVVDPDYLTMGGGSNI